MKNIATPTVSQSATSLSVAQVQEAIDRIVSDRAQLVQNRISVDQQLGKAQGEMGERYLAGERGHLQQVSALKVELEAIERALGLLEEQESAFTVELQRAKARELRDKAAAVRQQLATQNQKTAPLLEQLSALEGVTYTHSILSSQPLLYMPNDPNKTTMIWADPLTFKRPSEHQGVAELALHHVIAGQWQRVAMPRSRAILAEAEALEEQANAIEKLL